MKNASAGAFNYNYMTQYMMKTHYMRKIIKHNRMCKKICFEALKHL